MNNKTKRTIWQFPWRYTESIMMVIGLIVVGFALQLFVGKVDFFQLAYPVNLIIGGSIILFLLLFSFARNSQFYQWFSGVPFSVSLIGGLLILGIAMGLIPQMQKLDPHAHDMWTLLGLRFCAGVFCDFTFIRVAYYSSADTIRLERLRILFQSYWFVDIIICFGFGSRRSPPLCDVCVRRRNRMAGL